MSILENDFYLGFGLGLGNLLYFVFLLCDISLFIKIPVLVIGFILPLMALLYIVMFVATFFSMVWAIRKGCTCSWEFSAGEFEYIQSKTNSYVFGVMVSNCPYHREKQENEIVKKYLQGKDVKSLLTHKHPRIRAIAKRLTNV